MKYYVLLTTMGKYRAGDIFNFNAKNMLMSELDFKMQRDVWWEEVTREEAKEKGHYFVLEGKIKNFSDLDLIRAMH